ncbi:hypothetical protein SDRG_15094 [Saprolegnia diclina VS20]|uniref:Uncharacterized protein n=1 Tax=Saprolegnia diclina (strain VS20) TaxID=1156394 RepID=T0PNU5_SAPDV|nr:hypothetical protein SDRG_15094 [Saprolegnia diclina VS20]EQC27084.1 hypothetical protein SDRG_15094 [Saprolegnia diclina VS20]|eukprot:XP_008619478.1 hypothetical protein SDRG_15094 [Saprolegnia diclina VS20]
MLDPRKVCRLVFVKGLALQAIPMVEALGNCAINGLQTAALQLVLSPLQLAFGKALKNTSASEPACGISAVVDPIVLLPRIDTSIAELTVK